VATKLRCLHTSNARGARAKFRDLGPRLDTARRVDYCLRMLAALALPPNDAPHNGVCAKVIADSGRRLLNTDLTASSTPIPLPAQAEQDPGASAFILQHDKIQPSLNRIQVIMSVEGRRRLYLHTLPKVGTK